MAYITGIISEIEESVKQMRDPFGCNQRAGGREKIEKSTK